MLSSNPDDTQEERLVLSDHSTSNTQSTANDNSHHRKLIANTVVQLTNQVFGLDEKSEGDDSEDGEGSSSQCNTPIQTLPSTPIDRGLSTPSSADDVFNPAISSSLFGHSPDKNEQDDTTPLIDCSKEDNATSPPNNQTGILPLTDHKPDSLMPENSGKKRERRKEVLTNGSLRRSTRQTKKIDQSSQSKQSSQPLASAIGSAETRSVTSYNNAW